MIYRDEALRHLAFPLGGIGTGTVALGGEGGLRQWQLFNQINHRAHVPDSFFAARVTTERPPRAFTRIIQSEAALSLPRPGTPLVDDDLIPDAQAELVRRYGGLASATVSTRYPFATWSFQDDTLPVSFALEAYTPFVPHDVEASSLPIALFAITARNDSNRVADVRIAAALQNAVGWDGLTPITGNRCPLYGGNANRVHQADGRLAVAMTNSTLGYNDARAGEMVLAALHPSSFVFPRWTTSDGFLRFLEDAELDVNGGGRHGPSDPADVPSAAGETWNAGVVTPLRIAPHEEATATFAIGWWFPNRVVNWLNFGPRRPLDEPYLVGNAYSSAHAGALEMLDDVLARQPELRRQSERWADLFSDTGLPDSLAEGMAAQAAGIRSPVCFRTLDGRFYSFEGGNGASTRADGRGTGGSCPLNCTHVWNYPQAPARIFPTLERSMRETELCHMLHADGYLPHRVVLPLDAPQFEDEIGGPSRPALDGMLGCVLKVLRETRAGAGRAWLNELWPAVRRLLDYVWAEWDDDADGVLRGEQPNTYDIAFRGVDPFAGTMWLAALEAGQLLAEAQGDRPFARKLGALRRAGSEAYDGLLWNGEYYEQLLENDDDPTDQYGRGCLADHLLGQWWAHQLDLGYVLPRERVRASLQAIIQHNFRPRIGTIEHDGRVFADGDDGGLVLCSWPNGGRPNVPFPYCDEVWAGVEYQVAAHCLYESMDLPAHAILSALHRRYAGNRRNPYNQIECGDHYVRSLAGWSVLDALAGVGYDASNGTLHLHARPAYSGPWAGGTASGRLVRSSTQCTFNVTAGRLQISRIVAPRGARLQRKAPLPTTVSAGENFTIEFWYDGMR